jgi:hypothetical protein
MAWIDVWREKECEKEFINLSFRYRIYLIKIK